MAGISQLQMVRGRRTHCPGPCSEQADVEEQATEDEEAD